MFEKERDERQVNWLQLSDLHVFDEAATDLMLRSFEILATKIFPQFIVVTGDFRHLGAQTPYVNSKQYLEEIIKIFHITKENVFLIPGNHDVNATMNSEREEAISQITMHTVD